MYKPDGTVRKERRRYECPYHARELTFSCYRRLPLLSKDHSRQWFVDALDRARCKWGFELWAYVIMPEHVHVLLLPPGDQDDISLILKSIKQSVSRRAIGFLRERSSQLLERLKVVCPDGRTEYRFWQQGGGYDRAFYEDRVILASIDYFHLNPVHRGLVELPTDWRWSSARWYAGLDDIALEMDPLRALG